MATHTLARYISESTLQDYQFVHVKASLIAASSLYLSLRMKKLGPWVSAPSIAYYYPGKRVTSGLLHEERMHARGKAEGNKTDVTRFPG